jgi:pilus assembly protein CpaE
MDSAEKLDKQLLDSALTIHSPSKLAVLARPDRPEDAAKVHPVGLKRLLGVLGRAFDYIVIDSLLSLDPVSTTAIQAADEIILVMQVNVPSAKNAERFIGALRRLGVEQQRITLVANRYARNACNINPQEIERMLDMKIAWLLPEDSRSAVAASDFGEPLVLRSPRAGISTSLHHLAHRFNGKASHTN